MVKNVVTFTQMYFPNTSDASKIDWILGQALQDYPEVQVSTNFHASHLSHADYIVILSSSNREIQGLFEAGNHHATAVGKRINVSKTKVMSAFMPGEQRQTVFHDGEPLEDVEKCYHFGSMVVTYGQGNEDIRNKIGLVRTHSVAWSRHE